MTPDSFGLVGRWNRAVSATSASREERRERRLVIMRFFFFCLCALTLIAMGLCLSDTNDVSTVDRPAYLHHNFTRNLAFEFTFATSRNNRKLANLKRLQVLRQSVGHSSWATTTELPVYHCISIQHSAMPEQLLVGWVPVVRSAHAEMQMQLVIEWTNHRGERVWSGEEQEHY